MSIKSGRRVNADRPNQGAQKKGGMRLACPLPFFFVGPSLFRMKNVDSHEYHRLLTFILMPVKSCLGC